MAEQPENAGRGVHDQRTDDDRRADERLAADQGLQPDEAGARLARYGRNALEEKRRSVAIEFLSHFWGPIPGMIEAALVLTAVTRRWTDFTVIGALLLLNGGVGFWEEHQAGTAVAALKQRLARTTQVYRGGEWATVAAEELVPGDLVRVGRGEIVPADGRVVSGEGDADESALTGESLPVSKQSGADAYSGSAISRGSVVIRVIATGTSTVFGRTAELAGRKAPESHFQRAVVRIGTYLIVLAVTLVVVIMVVSVLRGAGVAQTLEFALVVIIASIPVALPAVLSVTMAVGARYLAKREAVVSHLPAIEEMAGVDVLCADKTGTVTRNELAVSDISSIAEDADDNQVLLEAALTAERDGQDPIDQAITQRLGPSRLDDWQVLQFVPFDSSRKYAQAEVRGPNGEHFTAAKGAVQAVLNLAGADSAVRERVSGLTREMASRGHRTLAVGREDDGRWRVTGVLGLQDPPRADSHESLTQAGQLGVQVKMVTGDRVEIAREIASEVGLGVSVLEAGQIEHAHEDDELADTVARADGFAQVVPEDKYRIVKALQQRDHIVAMTGDGVNDAPALRRADAGIAVSGATDAARAASDIVLLAPGLSTIVEAIHRAREVFERMRNYTIYRITETIRVVVFVTLTILIFAFFPITPIQVVLLAILNDMAILSIAYDRVRPASKPTRWDLTEVVIIAAVLGAVGTISTFILVWVTHLPLHIPDAEIRTLIYLKLSVSGHLTVFLARTRGPFWSHRPATILLVAVIGTQILASSIALTGILMQSIGWSLIGLAWGWAFVEFMILDRFKLLTYRSLRRHGKAAGAAAGGDPLRQVGASSDQGGRADGQGAGGPVPRPSAP